MEKKEQKIVKVINEPILIPEEALTKLTQEQKKFVEKLSKWATDNIKKVELDSITIGFPAGVSITLKVKR